MDLKKTGNLISSARREKGITQKELADKLHVSDRTVSKWERGAGFPDVSILTELADILGLTVTELLQGEQVNRSDSDTEAELTIREAVNVVYQQAAAKAKKNRMQLLSAVLIVVLVAGGIGLGLKKLGEDRILLPPKVSCEILQGRDEVDFAGEILVDREGTGVYDYTCRYEMDRYGNVQLTDRKMWQSYDDTVPADVYDMLQNLRDGQLTSIWKLETGWLAEYHEYNGTVTVIETDFDCQPVFIFDNTYDHITSCTAAFVSDGWMYIVSYNDDEQRIYVTSVNKSDGSSVSGSFSYEDLSGVYDSEKRVGGFLFDGRNIWVKDGILYFAETHYNGPPSAVMAAFNLSTGESLTFREFAESHVVMVRQELDAGKVFVLINPMNYQPLQLYELDAVSMEILCTKYLELPYEYLTNQDSRYQGSYLFEADMNEEAVLIKFPDVHHEEMIREQKTSSNILALYDRTTGEIIWRSRVALAVEYEIYDVELLNK